MTFLCPFFCEILSTLLEVTSCIHRKLLFFVNTPISLQNFVRSRTAEELLLTVSFLINAITCSSAFIVSQPKSFAISSQAVSPLQYEQSRNQLVTAGDANFE